MEVIENKKNRFTKRVASIVNATLVFSSLMLLALTVRLWTGDSAGSSLTSEPSSSAGTEPSALAQRPSYENLTGDLFRLPRPVKTAAVKKPSLEPPPPAQPPPPKPPPRVNLLGTVISDNGASAILEYPAGSGSGSYYRAGDRIEGFVIRRITKDQVILRRDEDELKVTLSQSGQTQATLAQSREPVPSLRPDGTPADIPGALLPRPRQAPASAPKKGR